MFLPTHTITVVWTFKWGNSCESSSSASSSAWLSLFLGRSCCWGPLALWSTKFNSGEFNFDRKPLRKITPWPYKPSVSSSDRHHVDLKLSRQAPAPYQYLCAFDRWLVSSEERAVLSWRKSWLWIWFLIFTDVWVVLLTVFPPRDAAGTNRRGHASALSCFSPGHMQRWSRWAGQGTAVETYELTR